ncbi:hypothetical protein C8039_07070 [Halogeometricum sp. wsp3]|nr:hypothetical protein C8039_07070 [Halogeometricum sp. wsp3]
MPSRRYEPAVDLVGRRLLRHVPVLVEEHRAVVRSYRYLAEFAGRERRSNAAVGGVGVQNR